MWFLTVEALIASWRAICLLERPCATSARISFSRADSGDSDAGGSGSRNRLARRLNIAAAMSRRALHAARHRVDHCAVKLVVATLPRDIAGKPGSGAGKHLAVGLIQRKGHQFAARAGLFDQPRHRGGSGLAQILPHALSRQ
jgi:hypothetical protein